MASSSFCFYVGPMFEVIAGLDHKCFLVHASILEKSDKLKAVVEGDWKESAERKVVLEDWDEGTVGRLVAWLYTGDYSCPLPTKLVDSMAVVDSHMQGAPSGQEIIPVAPPTEEALSTPEITQQGIALDANKAPIAGKANLPQHLTPLAKQAVNDSTKRVHKSSTELIDRWVKLCKHHPHNLDFEATLLAHAKVYCIANYMLLTDLQALAYQHIRSFFTWIDSRILSKSPTVSNLVTLIRYVYANTNGPQSGEEPLRYLLTTLIAWNFECFDDGEEGKVRRLMDKGGDFGTDVWQKVGRHVGALRHDLGESYAKIASLETEMSGMRKKRRTE